MSDIEMMMDYEVVEYTANYLDDVAVTHGLLPEDWRQNVDTGTLDLARHTLCIFGQNGRSWEKFHVTFAEDEDYPAGGTSGDRLNDAWIEYLTKAQA